MIWKVGMPNLGHTMEAGLVQEWTAAIGAKVERGECVALVESDKVTVEIEAPGPGVMLDIIVEAGRSVPVGATLALIGELEQRAEAEILARALRGEPDPAQPGANGDADAAPQRAAPEGVSPPDAGSMPGRERAANGAFRRRSSPLALRLATRHNVDVDAIEGTGPKGLVVKADVLRRIDETARADEGAGADGAVSGAALPLSGMRARVAQTMSRAWAQAPMVTLTRTIDVGATLSAPRVAVNGLRINDLVLVASARALTRHQRLNAWLTEDGLERRADVDLAFAVALEDGLITPVLRGAHRLDAVALAERARGLAERARTKSLKRNDLADASFTVSNLGGLQVDTFTPILNPPQVAILGVGRVRSEPALTARGVEFRSVIALCLTVDHRALDGADGARFLATMADLFADPQTLLQQDALR